MRSKTIRILGVLLISISLCLFSSASLLMAQEDEVPTPAPSPSAWPNPTQTSWPSPTSCTSINAFLSTNPYDPPHTSVPFIRGDANGDGTVTGTDLEVINDHLNRTANTSTRSPITSFGAGDVNNDNKIDSADRDYLVSYLAGVGSKPPAPFLKPAVASFFDCNKPSCSVVMNGKIVDVKVAQTAINTNSVKWTAVAQDYETSEIAQYDLTINYGKETNTATMTFKRQGSPNAWQDIPTTTRQTSFPATVNPTTRTRDEINSQVAIGIMSFLETTNREENLRAARFPSAPDGCNWPVAPWPNFGDNSAEHPCCDAHDLCYRRGGCPEDKQACDSAFLDCLQSKGNWMLDLCGGWVWRNIGVAFGIGTFGNLGFRFHGDTCTCDITPEALGNLTDSLGSVTLSDTCIDCPTCSGKCVLTWPQQSWANPRRQEVPCVRTCASKSSCPAPKPSPTSAASPTPAPAGNPEFL
jgi:hypothetical protein